MQASNIEWTDYIWSPTSGCTKVSAGCKNCYAEAEVNRWKGNSPAYPNGFDLTLKPHKLREPLTKRIPPSKIFVNSMSDLFHQDVPDDYIDQVFDVMEQCPQHTFQVLTKRPRRMAEYTQKRYDQTGEDYPEPLPNRNIWLGTSVENNRTLKRIATLLTVQTETIFVSFEPLLERIDLDRLADELLWAADGTLDWAIIGQKHSAKPDVAFEIIARNSPGPRLSIFERTPRDGFECWGDQMP